MFEKKKRNTNEKETISTTLIIVLISVVSITVATLAWFSIADATRLSNMRLDITTGKSLRFDLDEHESFEEYASSLSFEKIKNRIKNDSGIDISEVKLEPITTIDGKNFNYEDGTACLIEEEKYYEFTLHFMATTDMNVHLTTLDSKDGNDGTLIESDNPDTPNAMRVCFDTGNSVLVFDPGKDDTVEKTDKISIFGLLPKEKMKYNSTNMLFYLPAEKDVPVKVRIWLEGTDESCTNSIKKSDYSIQLRFEGTDNNWNTF